MTNAIDNAIARIQDIALALTSVAIKSAPDYPIENADPFPMVVTYLSSGIFMATNATTTHVFSTVNAEFHFSRVNLKQAYQQINLASIEFSRRLAGDPTLNGTVDSIIMTGDNPLAFTVRPFVWKEQTQTQAALVSQMLLFTIPLKTILAPQATA